MQANTCGMNRAYDRYQYIFFGLALWHLRLNYLKMIQELFYPGGSANKRFSLQWIADHCYEDKTTWATDQHLLENLTFYSYMVRIISIMKQWIEKVEPNLQLHNNKALKMWFLKITSVQWMDSMNWLDDRMEQEVTKLRENWNNY